MLRVGQLPKNFTVATATVSAVLLTIVALVSGWQRRWISDDGLIVLRTVRNLQAGNGPVFNAGERVETNTSTLWQYLIYFFAELTSGDLETVSLWLALICSGLAVLLGILGTGLLYRARSLLLLPLGMVIFVAIPAVRDFFTSGLEWGLSLLWVAVLWLLLVLWVRKGSAEAYGVAPRGGRHAKPVVVSNGKYAYALAFWAGLSWLVRPELALYGGITGLVLLLAARSWKVRALIMAWALPLPLAYQIFRMGYYGAIVPQTAVAKSASESLWGRGWDYVLDFANPYGIWWALAVVVLVAAVLLWLGGSGPSFVADANSSRLQRLVQPATPVAILVVCGLLHVLYVVKVGGDFMHGRMLLIPLFALLLPLAVVPWADLRGTSMKHMRLQPMVVGAGFIFALVWAGFTVSHPVSFDPEGVNSPEDLNVVDERTYWIHRTTESVENPPLYAKDYMAMDLMEGYEPAHEECRQVRESGAPADPQVRQCSGALLSIGVPGQEGHFDWIPAPAMPLPPEGDVTPGPAGGYQDLAEHPMTVNFLNLGMTGMVAPLDVRVVDPMGLANPLAARMPQIEGGRPGHDKYLPLEWQMADSAVDVAKLPFYIDKEEVARIRPILYTPEFAGLYRTYREPMSLHRFLANIKYSLTTSRGLEFSDDPDDYAGVSPQPDARIVWPRR